MLAGGATPMHQKTQGARIHTYLPTTWCRLPQPDNRNTVICADASGGMGLTSAGGGAAIKLRRDATGQLQQHHLTGVTIFGESSHGVPKTLAITLDAISAASRQPQDPTHAVLVVFDEVVDLQIIRRLAKQPLHIATDSSLGTQALYLWAAWQNVPEQVVLHLVKQRSHRDSLGNGHIDLHAHSLLPKHMPTPDEPSLHDHMHTGLQHLPAVSHLRKLPFWVPDHMTYKDTTTDSLSEHGPTSGAATPTIPS